MSQRVLIVEDEALIALDLSFCLEALGHEVVATAADSAEALSAAREGIDLAFVDLNLRDGPTGPALGEALARDWDATVIYLTANPRQVGSGVRGPVGILPKPYTEEVLAQAVRFAVSLRQGRSALPPPELRLLTGAATTLERAGRESRF
ncbi:Response regulator receiver domain-containing protein [Roseomonas rosea]|uniref:Response regulator receiver domain-containing protein n=1 Tax=Muricoccus roseus TaxID=198092 RepID=A0A1M6MBV5_9PROT|nr:response regulator [Roseomonas rosea]SHJ80951.1 Response regulator receiver domain-containing protein [Roseomonas rosea]